MPISPFVLAVSRIQTLGPSSGLNIPFNLTETPVDPILQYMTGAKHQNTARKNRNFFTGLWIAADALPFLTNEKAAKGRDLNHFAFCQSTANFPQHRFDQIRGLISREAYLLVNRLRKLGPG